MEKVISIRVKYGREGLTVWFPGLQLQAYTTKVKLVGRWSDYKKGISVNEEEMLRNEILAKDQSMFIESLERISDKEILSDGMTVYTVRKVSDLPKIDFSLVISNKSIPRPVYFVDEDGDLVVVEINGRFIDDENSVEFRHYLSGFARTKFLDKPSIT